MTNDPTSENNKNLVSIGKKIVKDVKAGLFVGRGNVHPDLAKTHGWSADLVIHCRNNRKWKKVLGKNGKTSWQLDGGEAYFQSWWDKFIQKKPTKEELTKGLNEHFGGWAARSYYNRAGNCDEMSLVALYLLAKQFAGNSEYRAAIDNGSLLVSKVALPQILSHTLVEIKIKEKDTHGNEVFNSIYIDPWLGGVYTSAEFSEYQRDIVDLFLKDYPDQNSYNAMRIRLWSRMEKEVEAEMIAENKSHPDAKLRQDEKVERIKKKIENEVRQNLMDAVTPQTISKDPNISLGSSVALDQYRTAFDEEFMRQINPSVQLKDQAKMKSSDLLVAFSQHTNKKKDAQQPLSSTQNTPHKPHH